MSSKCQISYCDWYGDNNDLFDHFEAYHLNQKREIQNDNHFLLTLDDLTKEPFLLCGENALYWFMLNPAEDPLQFERGLFAIGDSEITEYRIKIGTLATLRTEIYGPFQIQPETSQNYHLKLTYEHLIYLTTNLNPTVAIYLGEFNDDDDIYTGTWDDIDWTDPNQVELNEIYLDMFTCSICTEFIRKNARFCERRHYLCENCLLQLYACNKKAICPQCRDPISSNCQSEEVENLLKLIKFPNHL